MKPLTFPVRTAAVAASLLVGGCYNPKYPGDAPGTERSQAPQSANTVTNVYRTGPGTIETVNRSPSPSAVAGATNVRNDEVLLRMDDGTRQIILMPAGSTRFNAGDRVEVTSDRQILRR
jgi:outer membrane lipoprotein SlyB